MPNYERLRAWIDALRSGKYQQGYGRLHGAYGDYCCLGVACDLYAKAEGVTWTPTYGSLPFQLGTSSFVQPAAVDDWFGLPERSINIEVDGRSLTGWNDDRRLTFARIADLIEKEFFSEDEAK